MSFKYSVITIFLLTYFSTLVSYSQDISEELEKVQTAGRNGWVYLLIVFLLLLIIILVTRLMGRQTAWREKTETNQARAVFFNAFTFEIRTYLSLVSSPIDKLLEHSQDSRELRRYLKKTKRNSKRLVALLSGLLDFRKLEEGQIVLKKKPFDFVQLVKEDLPLFEYLWQEKKLKVSFQSKDEEIILDGDVLHIEKVLFNLFSNVYLYAKTDSKIDIEIRNQYENVILKLKTTGGFGVSGDAMRSLLFNFFQSRTLKGRNLKLKIDLAISKKIIELHNGTIKIESNSFEGENLTVLTIVLPKGKVDDYAHLPVPVKEDSDPEQAKEDTQAKRKILIVEDNEELLRLLSNLLKDYTIIACNNGSKALEKTLEIVPDLIISDIIMPELNGLDLCKAIKTEPSTSHIPFILLTAKAEEEHLLEGLAVHADHYMVKPFNLSELRLRVTNCMNMIDAQRSRFGKTDPITETSEISKKVFGENQVKKIIQIINDNLTNPDFGVDHLARESAMSRVVLYKKIRSLTGMTVNDFIKKIRFLKAADLLKTNGYSVGEVAEMVGFNDRRYFSKEFRRVHGKTPVEFAKATKENNVSGERVDKGEGTLNK